MKKLIKILIALFLPFLVFSQDFSFEILQQTQSEIIVKYIPQQYEVRTIEINQKNYNLLFGKNSGLTNEIGKPALPVVGTLIAIPADKKIVFEVIESKYITIENQYIAPVPKEFVNEENELQIEYKIDESFYNYADEYYPKDFIKIEQPISLRYNYVAKINFFPFQYNPSSKVLKQWIHFVFRLKLVSNEQKSNLVPIEIIDSHYEQIYKSLILNYEESKKLRYKPLIDTQGSIFDSTRNWWQTGRTYYKIPIASDGIYRLTYQQLINSGINLLQIPIETIAIYYKGKSIPIRIFTEDPDVQKWYIDFYGNRKYGDTTYFDIYSDTSIYWLTWYDSNPKRFVQQGIITPSPTYFVKTHYLNEHFERDSNYYYGYNDNEIRTVEDVPGEGWYWLEFFPNSVRTINFKIDTLPPPTGDTIRFKIRMNGMTAIDPPDTAVSRHLARLALNNHLIDSIFWIQNHEVLYTKLLKDSVLKKGTNSLEIRSINIPTRVNKFYLDWFEISYKAPLALKNNYLEFTSPSFPTSDPVEFEISNVTTDSIDIFDLTTQRFITNYYKVGNLWKFKDTCKISKRYIVIGRNLRSTPIYISPHTFSDIRTNSTGADYIIITHPLFKTYANALATDRQNRYNVRTQIVNVNDIYDEFNFGHINPSAIKIFLQFAYNNWQIPAPSYLTLFGDACFDYRKRFPTTIKNNYVPGFGNPMSDNIFVCFDTTYKFLPSMIVGRVPVENPIQAQQVLTKILNYENPPMDSWNKRMLFITGGTTPSEQWQFNSLSNLLINESVEPFPLGGEVFKVYKTSSAIIDGDYKYYMQNLVNQGLSFINFIGHSGGRIWNVDIGNPNDLQNTNGKLPFINSVSCNIGAFYSNHANVLSEDFLFAENKGAIGSWASSHISSANSGYWLTRKFLYAAVNESVKKFGDLTHLSKLYFWMINGYTTTPTIIHTFNLYPLIAEPFSRFAIPEKPNFVIKPEFISYSPQLPVDENFVYLKVILKNYGLMVPDSITIWIKDNYIDELGNRKGESDLVPPFKWRSFAYTDTINIEWDVRGKAGSHTITVLIDPTNLIDEIIESDNTAQIDIYVYKSKIYVLQPLPYSTTQSGTQKLRVTVPMVFDTTQTSYTTDGDTIIFYKDLTHRSQFTFYFELDTVFTFDSDFKISSPPVYPTQVFAEWITPSLPNEKVYYWRCRTFDGKYYSSWVNSSFNTSDTGFTNGIIIWNQSKPTQFHLNKNSNVEIKSNGVSMLESVGLSVYVRSLGDSANMDRDYYSIIKIGDVVISGLWWYGAYSYIIARIDPRTGNFVARGYTLSNLGQPDSMLAFIQQTPVGHYLAISVVRNGRSGMTESLYQAIENLGATKIRNVQVGQSWALISKKGTSGPMMPPLESYNPPQIADTDYVIPNYYRSGIGELTTPLIGPANSWGIFSWENQSPTNSDIKVYIIGVKKDYTIDTLFIVPNNIYSINLNTVDPYIYKWLTLHAKLSNTNGEVTPLLKQWKITYTPPLELATSPMVFSAPKKVKKGEPLDVKVKVYNLDNKVADSINVTFSILNNQLLENIWIDSISGNNYKLVEASLDVSNYLGEQILVTNIEPKPNFHEITTYNNMLLYKFSVDFSVSVYDDIQVTFDGKKISDGDYVSSRPNIRIILPNDFPLSELGPVLIDGSYELKNNIIGLSSVSNVLEFTPEFKDGTHNLTVMNKTNNAIYTINFKVSKEPIITDLFVYPNPFTSETYFTFNLAGERAADKVVIEIFTTSGRKINEIYLYNLGIGFQRVSWDGKDKDGNEVSNGIYLYRVKAKFDREISSKIDKVVRFR